MVERGEREGLRERERWGNEKSGKREADTWPVRGHVFFSSPISSVSRFKI
jgi:hypothetical protein